MCKAINLLNGKIENVPKGRINIISKMHRHHYTTLRRFFSTLVLPIILCAAAPGQGEQQPAEAKWVTISSPAEFARIKTKTAGNWILQDGVISLMPRSGEEGWKRFGSYLWLADDYGDFECEFEYQHEAGGNSGFYFRVADPKNPVKTGVELQLLDCHTKPQLGWHDLGGLIKQTKEGHQNPLAKATKPAGKWNTVSVRLKNKHVKITINGITVQDRPHDPELAGSGKIGFQDHGLPFHIRKLRISNLSSKLRPSKRL
jgi:hypothetical protein